MKFGHFGNRALFVGFGAFSVLVSSAVPAGALSLTNPPPRVVCVANGSHARPILTRAECRCCLLYTSDAADE